MAELINKNEFIMEIEAIKFSEDAKKMNVTYDSNMDGFFKGLVEGIAGFMPTTTEAEIRAKDIDEFAEEAKKQIVDFDTENGFVSIGVCLDIIAKVAEQLKERD